MLALGFLIAVARAVTAPALEPADLRAEYRANPLGLDTPAPRLSWVAKARLRGQRQTAYQVVVASTPELLRDGRGDLWDSGQVPSDAGLGVVYAGKSLRSGQRAHWKVRLWDRDGRPSAYGASAWWEMALLRSEDWRGTWIGRDRPPPGDEKAFFAENPSPLLRKAFRISDRKIERARAYVTGLGYYELRLNGERVGDHRLDPGWTNYDKRVLYSIYDVTAQLRSGDNVVGAKLGNGWYNPLPLRMFGKRGLNLRETLPIGAPKLLLHLEIEYTDGTRDQVVSDTSWRATDGPLRKDNIYLGEVYDARRAQPGWDRIGFDDRAWEAAVRMSAPAGALQAQDAPPIRAGAVIQPIALRELSRGVHVFDMGRNFAGSITLRVRGAAGSRVILRYGELLHPDGSVNVVTSAAGQIKNWSATKGQRWGELAAEKAWGESDEPPTTAMQSDTYVLRGSGLETYTPQFTWHGFRYVEVRGFPGRPSRESLEGHPLYSDVTPAGSFASSNPLFDRIQQAVLASQLSNMFSVQSDCPHRERFGYGGDIIATSEMAMLNFDMSRFYAKTARDFADAQRPLGGFTEIAPDVGIDSQSLGDGAGPVDWGTAHPMLVWQQYQYYGDRRLLEEQYEPARRWVDFLATKAVDGILDNGLSDHESLAPKPRALTGTASYAYSAMLVAQMARVLDRAADVARYEGLAKEIRAAFNRRFLDDKTGRYDVGTQAAQAFALFLDLAPPDPRIGQALVAAVAAADGHMTTGIFGTKYLLAALTDLDRADVAYAIANQRTFPGWGYMLDNGATTLWESWHMDPVVRSQNHPMFGSVSEWFYKALAGIRPEADAVGFDRVVIRPNVVGDLTWARGSYDSVRGRIASAWRVQGDTISLDVTVPVSVSATVFVPTEHPELVTESGVAARKAPGIAVVRDGVYRVGGGQYRFVAPRFRSSAPAEPRR